MGEIKTINISLYDYDDEADRLEAEQILDELYHLHVSGRSFEELEYQTEEDIC